MSNPELARDAGCPSCGYPDHAGHAPGCGREAERTLDAKIAAIARQSPSLSPDVIRRTTQQEVNQGTSVEARLILD